MEASALYTVLRLLSLAYVMPYPARNAVRPSPKISHANPTVGAKLLRSFLYTGFPTEDPAKSRVALLSSVTGALLLINLGCTRSEFSSSTGLKYSQRRPKANVSRLATFHVSVM